MLQTLKNKVAIVFGATGGLGQAVVKKYIDQGAHVISVGRNLKILEELDDYAQTKGSSTTIVALDAKESGKIKHLAQELQQRFGKIDILVSTVAILGEVTPLNYYDEEIWENVINTNLTTNWKLIKYLHPLLLQSEHAVALFCGCSMSQTNNAYWGAYSVSKAALENLVKIYAEETKTTNIRVYLVDPGPIATKLRCAAFPGKNEQDYQKPEAVADLFVTSITRSNIMSGSVISYKEFAKVV